MKIAVITDPHGNLPALRCVQEDMADQKVDEVWCLGDVIGYGADPWECWRISRDEMKAKTLMGNHENALIDAKSMMDFNYAAVAGVEFALMTAPAGTAEEIAALPQTLEFSEYGAAIAHGSFSGDNFNYIYEKEAPGELNFAPSAINFIGHTHKPLCYAMTAGRVKVAKIDSINLDQKDKYLINPGSVGQPRDKDNRAAYGILEIKAYGKSFAWRRVAYPIREAAESIRKAGLPEKLALRLYIGE